MRKFKAYVGIDRKIGRMILIAKPSLLPLLFANAPCLKCSKLYNTKNDPESTATVIITVTSILIPFSHIPIPKLFHLTSIG